MTDKPDEELAFDAQIKRLYAVLHSLGIDPKDFKKNQNITSYAKLTRRQVSDWITELEQREKENKEKETPASQRHGDKEGLKEIMHKCLKDAAQLVNNFLDVEDITNDTRLRMISEIAIALFKERVKG